MKVVMKEIEVIAWHNEEKYPTPIRIRYTDKAKGNTVIPIHLVSSIEEEKIVGNRMLLYRCQSTINNREVVFELKYDIEKCKWYLFKI